MNKDFNIKSGLSGKEHDKVQQNLEDAVQQLTENPDEFLKTLKPFII